MREILLTLENLSKFYMAGGTVTAGLNGVDLAFSQGEFVAVTGESGSGKSTLAHVIAGILPYEGGELYVKGRPTSHYDGMDWEQYRRDSISYISQDYGILPGSSVTENVVSALRLAGMDAHEAAGRAEEILREVELWEMRKRRAAKLSSGQKQRLAIARALAKPAPILLADEPTGNLDPENSRKVIELLTKAAKERLVILITHDYDEAAPYVTRRIVLQEGQISADSRIRELEAEEVDIVKTEDSLVKQDAESAKEGMPEDHASNCHNPLRLGFYAAGLQLRARPVWTAFMVAFFALTAFAVFSILGTFYVALDDVSTRYYDNEAFRNGDRTRLEVRNWDGEDLTEEDLETLAAIDHVSSLERYGAAVDVNYYYREGIDYEYRYTNISMGGMQEDVIVMTTMFLAHNNFVRTIPMLPEGEEFLTAGVLPEHMNEVVAVGDSSLIGTTMSVYIQDRKNWDVDSYIALQMKVVGVTDYGKGLYFHEDVGRMLNQSLFALDKTWYLYGSNPSLSGNEVRYTMECIVVEPGADLSSYSQSVMKYLRWNPAKMLRTNGPEDEFEEFVFSGHRNESTLHYYTELSEEKFDEYTMQGIPQVSLFMEDYSYMDRVIKEVKAAGYDVISPYRLGSVKQSESLAQERLMTLGICLLAMTAILLLQILIVRAMFGLQMASFETLRDMGLTCKGGQYSILGQILILTVVGQLAGLVILWICGWVEVEKVVDVLKYLTIVNVLLLCALHMAASLLTTLWSAGALRRKVFPFVKREADLNWEEAEG